MPMQSGAVVRITPPPSSKLAPDRRRHKRFEIVLFGRFMRQTKHEYPCKLMDISVGGAALGSPVTPEIGETIIAYFDQLGGLQGTVVRTFEGGFAMSFSATQHKREKLAAQITWLVNRHDLGGPEDRRHERIKLKDNTSTLQIAGETFECSVIDVSVSGASVRTATRPEIGTEVILGKTHARVVRRDDSGLGLEFVHMQDPESLRRHFS
jgi:hypothetical protein